MVLASQTTKTVNGGMINEWLAVKAAKGKGQVLYIEDAGKAMQVVKVVSVLPKICSGHIINASWQLYTLNQPGPNIEKALTGYRYLFKQVFRKKKQNWYSYYVQDNSAVLYTAKWP